MSLDVYLKVEKPVKALQGSGIFVREKGQNREVTPAEYLEMYPGRTPLVVEQPEETRTVYSANITHNLNKMASEAGLYKYLWRPDEIGIEKAHQLIAPLTEGLNELRSRPEHYMQFNPDNGWGDYDGLVIFTRNYLEACEVFPDALVIASR